MATLFMSRPRASASVDPRDVLSLERHASEYLAKLAQIDALNTRRAEEAAKGAELAAAIPGAETALSDLEIVTPQDE